MTSCRSRRIRWDDGGGGGASLQVCAALIEEVNCMDEKQFNWDIRREGHAWGKDTLRRYLRTEEDRLNVLAMLLENVGVDKAMRLGDPNVWREAIKEL